MENKLGILSRIKEIYDNGENIIQYLKGLNNRKVNNIEDILISYDFQAGSYISFANENPNFINKYTKAISNEIKSLNCITNSILEVGVGEATTLANLIEQLNNINIDFLGFDISWSRIHFGNSYLKDKRINNVSLFTGDLFNIPLSDNSIDVVYTSHSLEPNGGKEKEALIELYRITNKYLILLEPAYEFADEESKNRMISHGYVRNLVNIAKDLGYVIKENCLFEICSNNLNPTQIIIIEKASTLETNSNITYYCPITKTILETGEGYYFSAEGLLVYPIIKNIPCLLPPKFYSYHSFK